MHRIAGVLCAVWIAMGCAGASSPGASSDDASDASADVNEDVAMGGDVRSDIRADGLTDADGAIAGDAIVDADSSTGAGDSVSDALVGDVGFDVGEADGSGPGEDTADTVDAVAEDVSETTSTTESVALGNPWGIAVSATLHAPLESVGAPAVMLIHQYNQSSVQWDPWVPGLLAHGWRVLTVDLPFHGDSDPIPGANPSDLLQSPDLAPLVVLSALEWLGKSGGADPDRIAIVGTSIGANLACVFNANANPLGLGAKLGVAISPRDTAVFQLAGDPKSISFTGMYFLASENDNDGVQAATCTTFGDLTDPPVEVVIVPDSAAHGLLLLEEEPGLWDGVDSFLSAHL